MVDKEPIIEIPDEARTILRVAGDLYDICRTIPHVIHGSLGAVLAVGAFYPRADGSPKIPGDVDAWFDRQYTEAVRDGFLTKGYTSKSYGNSGQVYPDAPESFTKNGVHIDLHGVDFDERGITVPLRLPIPGIPIELRPMLGLRYPPTMAQSTTYNVADQEFTGLTREALWLKMFVTKQLLGDDKNTLELERLGRNLNQNLINRMLAEKPGLYYRRVPLLTANRPSSINLAAFTLRKTKHFLERQIEV